MKVSISIIHPTSGSMWVYISRTSVLLGCIIYILSHRSLLRNSSEVQSNFRNVSQITAMHVDFSLHPMMYSVHVRCVS